MPSHKKWLVVMYLSDSNPYSGVELNSWIFLMGFNIIAPYMEMLHINRSLHHWTQTLLLNVIKILTCAIYDCLFLAFIFTQWFLLDSDRQELSHVLLSESLYSHYRRGKGNITLYWSMAPEIRRHWPNGMAEWSRRETSELGVLGSNPAQVSDCSTILPGPGGYPGPSL